MPFSFCANNLRCGQIGRVKALIQSLLRPFGLRLTRLANERRPDYGPSVLFATLKRFGFSPRLVLDIGANHGNWRCTALSYFPEAEFVLVEPQDHLKLHIQDLIDSGKKIRWVNAGVADKAGIMRFYISEYFSSQRKAAAAQSGFGNHG
jgi:hypothetical protein